MSSIGGGNLKLDLKDQPACIFYTQSIHSLAFLFKNQISIIVSFKNKLQQYEDSYVLDTSLVHSTSSRPHAFIHICRPHDDTRKKTPYANFCVSALRSDPWSSTADTPKLGLITVDKVNANAKSTLTKIKDLLGKSPNPGTKQALISCKESYKFVISDLVPSSKESLTEGDYKFAVDNMTEAAIDASECEAGFGGKSALLNSNDYENKAALVASAIARSLP